MKTLVLAAGRGERMRPLTDTVPKALLRAGGRSLIEWLIARLMRAGFRDLVINVSHLGERIEAHLRDGTHLGVRIEYSREPIALETAGGIAQALAKLGSAPFLAVNADIYCEYDFARLRSVLQALACTKTPWNAHLVLVNNPPHHPRGDFCLAPDGTLHESTGTCFTFSGIGAYRPQLFDGVVPGERRALGPLLRQQVSGGQLRAEHYAGPWMDIGTPERLRQLRDYLGAGHDCG
jgi:MurNAc alpha-1-phosphate uridylyltransferase